MHAENVCENKSMKPLSRSYSYFKKRTCNRFAPANPDSEICCCGLSKSGHSEEAKRNPRGNEVKWDPKQDTIHEPTDAYGHLEFSGAGQMTRAKYIRIAHDTDATDVLKFMTSKWKLKLPKLLISVTGGAKNFILHPKLKQILRQGLLKAASTTGAWIITGGTNTGVMKHVGEAVRGQTMTSCPAIDDPDKLKLIGIPTWGIVEERDKILVRGEKKEAVYPMKASMTSGKACLDNNHTHFILVDDGTNGKYGKEIAFRASLENLISRTRLTEDKDYGIPVVLLVLEGGPNTIKTVLESVTGDPAVPAVITHGSGRAANIISFAYGINDNDNGNSNDVKLEQLMEMIKQAYPTSKEEEIKQIYENVQKCVSNKRYITIFRINEEGVDIDKAILRALLKAQHASPYDQLNLALVWNRVDIAKSAIFVENQKWQAGDLENAMLDALSNDRVEFVKVLQKNRVSIEYFLTRDKLLTLYRKRSKVSVALQQLLGQEKLNSGFTLDDINKIINGMLGGKRKEKFTTISSGLKTIAMVHALRVSGHEDTDSLELFENPYDELFLWAVLCNMQKMALFMWERGDSNLAKALIGARMYMDMARKMESENMRNDVHDDIIAHAQEFKGEALALVDECYRANEMYAQKLLTYHLEDWCGHSCLSLAVALDHDKFVAHAACQSLLSEIWMRTLRNVSMWKIFLGVVCLPIICCLEFKTKKELSLLPVTLMENRQAGGTSGGNGYSDESEESEEENLMENCKTRTTCLAAGNGRRRSIKYEKASESLIQPSVRNRQRRLTPWTKFYEFHCAPVTKFCSNVIGYVVFLMLFSYVILVGESDRGYYWEILLIVFLISLGIEEMRQIIQSDRTASGNRLKTWASRKWNICDGIAVLLFFVGMGLRFHSSTKLVGHVIYSLDIMLWIIRLLDILSITKHLGPYVVMIERMTHEMLYFLVIMVVFLLAYGVAQHAILFPEQKATWSLIPMIFFRPYFQTYGELFITDPLHLDDRTTEFSTPKHNEYSGRITTVILAFYLLVANILLLNLLIAIFNHIFAEVRADSKQIWKFQRYWLILEYAQRPTFAVPPFNILYHVFSLFTWLWKRSCCRRKNDKQEVKSALTDNRFKLYPDEKELEELMIFEEYRLYCYVNDKETRLNASSDERMKVIVNRVESMSIQLEEMAKKLRGSQDDSLQSTADIWLSKLSNPETESLKNPRDEPDNTPHVHVHMNARKSPYPMSNVVRFVLKDEEVNWKVHVQNYRPPRYTADTVLRDTQSMDPEIPQSGSNKKVMLSFNEIDGNINRQSYVGIYDVIEGLPRNPMGRTGLTGRGLLEHWGPNHVDRYVITRWRRTSVPGAEKQDTERALEFIAVKRDSHHWVFPETRSTVDKSSSADFKKGFYQEVLSNSDRKQEQKQEREKCIFESGIKVFRGYVDDKRNTDNAWLETMVTNYHDETGEILGNVDFGDKPHMIWLEVDSQTVPESEANILKKVAELHKPGIPNKA